MPEVLDPYLDPDTGLLRNLVGARTQDALDRAEADLTYIRAVELQERPVPATGDLDEFRALHRALFADVYEWAGEIRTVDLRKHAAGSPHFLAVGSIERGAMFAAGELRQDRMLHGMTRDRFIDRLSHHYDQWNHIHSFREGNGRVQRMFWNRVAADAGWQLDWRSVQGPVNNAACRASGEHGDFGPLRTMFDQVVSPTPAVEPPGARPDLALRATRLLEQQRATTPKPESPGGVEARGPSQGI